MATTETVLSTSTDVARSRSPVLTVGLAVLATLALVGMFGSRPQQGSGRSFVPYDMSRSSSSAVVEPPLYPAAGDLGSTR